MTLTYDAAVDEMFGQFRAAWIAGSAAIVGYVPEVRWPGVEPKNPDGSLKKPESDKYWARVSQQGVDDEQTSLSACVESNEIGATLPASRFTAIGLLFVQLFCPKTDPQGVELGRKLASLSQRAYRGKKTSGGVWFRNVRIIEVEDEELWHRFNVVAEYEYDEVA